MSEEKDNKKKECKHDYKYDENRGGMESEYYECVKCGDFYRLYYEDMA